MRGLLKRFWRSAGHDLEDLRYALSLKEFEPEGWRDWALIPGHVLCWAIAFVWQWPWYLASHLNYWFRNHCRPVFRVTRWILPLGGGRWESPDPIICPRCWWGGATRALVHTYASYGEDDVEPVNECPRCGAEI